MMIGLEAPGPGNSVFQARLAESDQAVGAALLETPAPAAPRKRGQSSAPAVKHNKEQANTTARFATVLAGMVMSFFLT